MKNLLTLLMVLFVVNLSLAQSKNKERLDEIDNLIEQAVEAGDYDQAAQLKKEKTIRLDIEKALADQDYDKAEELKSELDRMENGQKNEAVREEKVEEKTQESNVRVAENNSEPISANSGKDYIFKRGFALDFLVQFYSADYGSVGGAIQIGNKWYFGNNPKFRAGFQVNWIRAGVVAGNNLGFGRFVIPTIAPLNVGFISAIKFGENIGLEANLNMGAFIYNEYDYSLDFVETGYYWDSFGNYQVTGYYEDAYNERTTVGFNIGPAAKFRYKALSAGIDVRFIPVAIGQNSRKTLTSITLGFKW